MFRFCPIKLCINSCRPVVSLETRQMHYKKHPFNRSSRLSGTLTINCSLFNHLVRLKIFNAYSSIICVCCRSSMATSLPPRVLLGILPDCYEKLLTTSPVSRWKSQFNINCYWRIQKQTFAFKEIYMYSVSSSRHWSMNTSYVRRKESSQWWPCLQSMSVTWRKRTSAVT